MLEFYSPMDNKKSNSDRNDFVFNGKDIRHPFPFQSALRFTNTVFLLRTIVSFSRNNLVWLQILLLLSDKSFSHTVVKLSHSARDTSSPRTEGNKRKLHRTLACQSFSQFHHRLHLFGEIYRFVRRSFGSVTLPDKLVSRRLFF